MIALTAAEIAAIVGGHFVQSPAPPAPAASGAGAGEGTRQDAAPQPGAAEEIRVTGNVVFDSRQVGPGDLFLAIDGARVDGHTHAAAAIAAGAALVLSAYDCATTEQVTALPPAGIPQVIVPPVAKQDTNSDAFAGDTRGYRTAVIHAVGKLAQAVIAREQSRGLTMVGVTGSAGKTSTKDMIGAVLEVFGSTVAPAGSSNNELGMPMTALKVTERTDFLVAEMAARGVGHIAQLVEIARPQVGVVLNVGSAHVGEFGGKDKIAEAKSELIQQLTPQDFAVLNLDDPAVAAMRARTAGRVLTFSSVGETTADLYATDIRFEAGAFPTFTLHYPAAPAGVASDEVLQLPVTLRVMGAHQVSNALAALATSYALGLDMARAAQALRTYQAPSVHRMALHEAGNGALLIDDAYNANPESMRAGLGAAAAAARARGGRVLAALGPMFELGEEGHLEHQRLGNALAELGIDQLIAVGEDPLADALASGAQAAHVPVTAVPDADAAAARIAEQLQPADVVIAKASNGARLWEVIEKLQG